MSQGGGFATVNEKHGVFAVSAALDAIQYMADGPCVAAVEEKQVPECTSDDLLDEARWQPVARATAASSIASTLALPMVFDDRVMGPVNLYSAAPDSLTGRHEAVAAVGDAWVPGVARRPVRHGVVSACQRGTGPMIGPLDAFERHGLVRRTNGGWQ